MTAENRAANGKRSWETEQPAAKATMSGGSTPPLSTMSYKEQMAEWLRKHPKATPEQIWEAGYMTCSENWCRKRR